MTGDQFIRWCCVVYLAGLGVYVAASGRPWWALILGFSAGATAVAAWVWDR